MLYMADSFQIESKMLYDILSLSARPSWPWSPAMWKCLGGTSTAAGGSGSEASIKSGIITTPTCARTIPISPT